MRNVGVVPFTLSFLGRSYGPEAVVGAIFTGALNHTTGPVVSDVAAPSTFIIKHAASVLRDENAYQLDDPFGGSSTEFFETNLPQ